MRIPVERSNVDCSAADRGGPASLLPSVVHLDESVLVIPSTSHDPDTDMIGSNGQPMLLPPAHGERPTLLDHGDSVSMSADSGSDGVTPSWV